MQATAMNEPRKYNNFFQGSIAQRYENELEFCLLSEVATCIFFILNSWYGD